MRSIYTSYMYTLLITLMLLNLSSGAVLAFNSSSGQLYELKIAHHIHTTSSRIARFSRLYHEPLGFTLKGEVHVIKSKHLFMEEKHILEELYDQIQAQTIGMYHRRRLNDIWHPRCQGFRVSPTHIITARHCFEDTLFQEYLLDVEVVLKNSTQNYQQAIDFIPANFFSLYPRRYSALENRTWQLANNSTHIDLDLVLIYETTISPQSHAKFSESLDDEIEVGDTIGLVGVVPQIQDYDPEQLRLQGINSTWKEIHEIFGTENTRYMSLGIVTSYDKRSLCYDAPSLQASSGGAVYKIFTDADGKSRIRLLGLHVAGNNGFKESCAIRITQIPQLIEESQTLSSLYSFFQILFISILEQSVFTIIFGIVCEILRTYDKLSFNEFYRVKVVFIGCYASLYCLFLLIQRTTTRYLIYYGFLYIVKVFIEEYIDL